MQKSKRKNGRRNFWQRFSDKYILIQHEYHYEIDRAPRKVVARLEKYWQKHWQKPSWPYGNLNLDEAKHETLWIYNLSLPNNQSKISGEIYLEDDMTIIEGKIQHETQIFWLIVPGIILTVLAILLFALGRYEAILCSIIPFTAYLLSYSAHKNAMEKIAEVHRFWEEVLEREDTIIQREWEQYEKAKNEEVSSEILQEERK